MLLPYSYYWLHLRYWKLALRGGATPNFEKGHFPTHNFD